MSLLKAKTFLKNGNLAAAQETVEAILRKDPGNIEALRIALLIAEQRIADTGDGSDSLSEHRLYPSPMRSLPIFNPISVQPAPLFRRRSRLYRAAVIGLSLLLIVMIAAFVFGVINLVQSDVRLPLIEATLPSGNVQSPGIGGRKPTLTPANHIGSSAFATSSPQGTPEE